MRPLKICPSILSADFSRLGEEVRDIMQAGADVVREFRVYNSRLIPRLFATTFRTAPLPKLHGVSW
jgi:hypothetical protein